jgi:hypothetical protein
MNNPPENQSEDQPKSQNESDRWLAADYRLMWITFGATLAANIATVLLVAAAITIVRTKTASSIDNISYALGSALVTALIFGSLSGRWWRRIHIPSNFNARLILVGVTLYGVLGLSILVAKAANIK